MATEDPPPSGGVAEPAREESDSKSALDPKPDADEARAAGSTANAKVVLYSGIQLASSVVPSAFIFITLMVPTRLLPPDEYGAFGLASAITQMVASSLFGWIVLCVMRLGPSAPAEKFRGSVLAMFAAIAAAALLAAGLFCALRNDAPSAIWLASVAGGPAFCYVSTSGMFKVAGAQRGSRPVGLDLQRAARS